MYRKVGLSLKFFFAAVWFISLFFACSNEKDNIVPYAPIDAIIYLNSHPELIPVGNAKYFDNLNGKSLGYLGHGIIVIHSNERYIAYDATCTHDVEAQSHAELKDFSSGIAECPLCNSKFNLLDGYPFNNSLARYPLKEYLANFNPILNTLQISN